ncbi:Alpha/Beta hydrolase protein [Tricladium varicosporioides]|nr:Alpha/Beta hydrolase protein [Hymenoscyphus varicosporioides]
MSSESHTFTLADGRTIAWCEYGDASSPHPPVFYFHSFPSAGCEGGLLHETALKLHLRIISPDRPGYGDSSLFDAPRTFLTYPADIIALADHLKISQFQILSVSGGSPYLLACLKEISKDRCLGAQSVSGIYPLSLGTKGMAFLQRAIMFVANWTPSSFVGALMNSQLGTAARDPDPKKLEKAVMDNAKGLPERDRLAFEKESFKPYMVNGLRAAFRTDGAGAGFEAGLYATDWGFTLEEVDATRLRIWHGGLDTNVPFQMAEKAAKLMPAAKTTFLDGEGHSVIAWHLEDILKGFVPAPA